MQEKSRCTLDRTTNLSHGPFNDAMEEGSLVVQWSFRFGTNSFLPWVEKIKDIRKATQQYKIKFLKSTQTRLQTQIKNSNSWKILNKKKAFPSRNKVKTINQGKKNKWQKRQHYHQKTSHYKDYHSMQPLPVQRARKFSAVLGAISEKSCRTKNHRWINKNARQHSIYRYFPMHPTKLKYNDTSKTILSLGSPSIHTSIKTNGFFFFAVFFSITYKYHKLKPP